MSFSISMYFNYFSNIKFITSFKIFLLIFLFRSKKNFSKSYIRHTSTSLVCPYHMSVEGTILNSFTFCLATFLCLQISNSTLMTEIMQIPRGHHFCPSSSIVYLFFFLYILRPYAFLPSLLSHIPYIVPSALTVNGLRPICLFVVLP